MARKSIDELEVFLLAQDVPTLAGVLLELSHEHDAVRHRLERLRLATGRRAWLRRSASA
ncbi:hypothetical protein [Ramlibacter lithotrophicus]|uniref:hypothetical protein n=1 Tax=Ramlibacter lithotrophicus TaxID=2606681 RepID=UPI001438CB4D|nr:hypothetical protein [Ramlibacter lithotrophicus]